MTQQSQWLSLVDENRVRLVSTRVAGKVEDSKSQYIQCVTARRPSKSPASPKRPGSHTTERLTQSS